MLFPAADPNDGLIDLVLVAPMSPLAALTVRRHRYFLWRHVWVPSR